MSSVMECIVNQALSVFVTNLQISHILLCLKVGMISLKQRCVTGSLSLVCSGAGWRYKIRGRGVQGAGPLHGCTTRIHWLGNIIVCGPLRMHLLLYYIGGPSHCPVSTVMSWVAGRVCLVWSECHHFVSTRDNKNMKNHPHSTSQD